MRCKRAVSTRKLPGNSLYHGFPWVEEHFPRAGEFEEQAGIGSGDDPFGDADAVADLVADGGGIAGFSEGGRLHGRE